MEDANTRVNIVFLDCCWNDLSKDAGPAGLAAMSAKGTFIGFATGTGMASAASPTGSPYTEFLAKRMGIDAARGLTTTEAEDAFALSVVECGDLSPTVIAREKAQAVKKNGLLELIETRESLASIGGLDLLKDWLLKRREAFTPRVPFF